MAFWTSEYLSKLRDKIKSSIAKVQYKIGSTWYTATINQVTVSGTQVILFVSVPNSGNAQTITGVRIYDTVGDLAGEQTCSITRTSAQNLLLKFEFPLTEV